MEDCPLEGLVRSVYFPQETSADFSCTSNTHEPSATSLTIMPSFVLGLQKPGAFPRRVVAVNQCLTTARQMRWAASRPPNRLRAAGPIWRALRPPIRCTGVPGQPRSGPRTGQSSTSSMGCCLYSCCNSGCWLTPCRCPVASQIRSAESLWPPPQKMSH